MNTLNILLLMGVIVALAYCVAATSDALDRMTGSKPYVNGTLQVVLGVAYLVMVMFIVTFWELDTVQTLIGTLPGGEEQ